MALQRNKNAYVQYQQQAIAEAEKKGKGSNFNNPFQIKMEAGKSYRLRLLFDESDKRTGPFVEKYVHGGKDSQDKWRSVTCPTTHKPTAYSECPICTHNNKLYKSFESTGMERDKQLLDMYKRKFNGFALCYVVSDPTTPENNGHVRYFRFSIFQKKWLKRKIDGIIDTYKMTEEEIASANANLDPVGYQAFDLDNGYDLIVSVGTQGKFLSYDYDFARQATVAKNIVTGDKYNIELLETELKEIDFDQHITSSSEEDLNNFYRTVILDSDETDELSPESGVAEESISVDDIKDINDELDDAVSSMELGAEAMSDFDDDDDDDDDFDIDADDIADIMATLENDID